MGNSLDDHLNKSVAWLPKSFDRLFQAFDIAWPVLMPIIQDRGLPDEKARRQLADVVLLVAEDNCSASEIARAALQRFGI
jgi:hypothetical protein